MATETMGSSMLKGGKLWDFDRHQDVQTMSGDITVASTRSDSSRMLSCDDFEFMLPCLHKKEGR